MAKKALPIKSDLFRFVTFRGADEINYQSKATRFVLIPNISKSIINSCPVPSGKDESTDAWDKYLKRFPSFGTKQELRKSNPSLFDYANSVHRQKIEIINVKKDAPKEVQPLKTEEEIKLFDALLGEVLSRKSSDVRQAIAQMIIVNHVLKGAEEMDKLGMRKLTEVKIEIPIEAIECLRPWLYNGCDGKLDGVQNLGVADFRKVEQEVCCYVPGEVSHVENVMAKEYKERATRNFLRTVDTTETKSETTVENLTDVTTATRNELSSEIINVLEEEDSTNYGGSLGVSAEYMKAKIDVNAYADFANSNSSSYSNTQAQTYAEEVTKRALERIVQKTSIKRTSKIIKEYEENNKHGFDNRKGDKHVTGVYRWLDIIYTNRLVNYGKRLMVEFMVPEPAEFYKNVLKYKAVTVDGDEASNDTPEPPKELSEFGITKADDIDAMNVANAAAYYGVSIDQLPAGTMQLTKSLAPAQAVDHNRNINTQTLTSINVLPTDYEADKITGSYTYEYRANSWTSSQQAFCNFTFGGKIVNSGGNYSGDKETKTVTVNVDFNPNIGGSIPVSVAYSGCFGFYGAVTIHCVLKASVITSWQNDAYNKLLSAYNQMLDAYNEYANVEDSHSDIDSDEESNSTNPAMNRIIEQRELKRICIEMLMKPFCKKQGRDNNIDQNACDKYLIPQVNQNSAFTEYARTVKFFEQAIDWQIMSYLFYPYYWADKCDWADLMKSESEDLIFQAFLQSGMGRVVVPIREQFTEAFAYYLKTGDIWLGNNLVSGDENDLYLSIAEEMQTIEGVVEEEWETRVPTSLAIIQGKSAFLEDEGLPCCSNVENEVTTSNIVGSDTTLEIVDPTTVTP